MPALGSNGFRWWSLAWLLVQTKRVSDERANGHRGGAMPWLSGTTDFYQGHTNRHDQGPRADEPGATGALCSMHPLDTGAAAGISVF